MDGIWIEKEWKGWVGGWNMDRKVETLGGETKISEGKDMGRGNKDK